MQSNFNPRSPWGERLYTPIIFSRKRDFNPRSPWGERHQTSGNIANNSYISIHALREESDERIEACTAFCPIFQSTLSVRRATLRGTLACKSWFYFNPRSPWGERRFYQEWIQKADEFQSTLSVRRATFEAHRGLYPYGHFNPRSPWGERLVKAVGMLKYDREFQSTLSVRRATPHTQHSFLHPANFNPRSPWGERRSVPKVGRWSFKFQSTLSVRRAT